MHVCAALYHARFDSRRAQVESFFAEQNRCLKRCKRWMCREKKKKKKLFLFSLCFFSQGFCICVRAYLRVKFWF
jgi:hypothetical protein